MSKSFPFVVQKCSYRQINEAQEVFPFLQNFLSEAVEIVTSEDAINFAKKEFEDYGMKNVEAKLINETNQDFYLRVTMD